MPKVTVLLTSYNHARFIRESIDSILAQTFDDFEFYIVDDCSSDNSWDIIQSYDDSRIIAIRHEQNTNLMIEPKLFSKFKGEYFAIAHCDDKWAPEKLEKQVNFLENHPSIAACFTDVQLIDEQSNCFYDETHPYFTIFLNNNMSRHEWLREFFDHGNRLCHPSCIMRLAVQLEEGLYTAGMGALPDFYRWVKLCSKHDIYVYPEKLTFFRVYVNGENVSGLNTTNITRCQNELFFISHLYKNLPVHDLKLVFPEYNNSDYDTKILKEIILYNAFINSGYKPYQLVGLDIRMLNLMKSVVADNINVQDHKSLIEQTGKIDVFGVVGDEMSLNCTLFYSQNQNFNLKNSMNANVFLCHDYFELQFDISNIKGSFLRFDPDEGVYRRFWDLHIFIDDDEVEYKCIGESQSKGDMLFFYTSDPSFFFKKKEKMSDVVKIVGRTSIIPSADVDGYFKNSLRKAQEDTETALDEMRYLKDGYSRSKHFIKRCFKKLKKAK